MVITFHGMRREMSKQQELNPVWNSAKPFVNGGLSGMASTCIIQPIDMVKVRLQLGETGGPVSRAHMNLSQESRCLHIFLWRTSFVNLFSQIGIAAKMIRTQGLGGMYKGLSAGLLRQATYTTARMGIYNNLTAYAVEYNEGKPVPLWQKAACGLTAGGLGALVGNPADLTLLRMQADTTLPMDQRRNYKGVGDAFARIVREEGFGGLFTGATPTVVRAMALNMGMLASNDQAKEMLEGLGFQKGGSVVVLGGATIAGIFAAVCSLPFDYVKTQLQKMKPDANGKMPYTGAIDCAMKTLAEGGPLKFYTGLPTYMVRISPHATLTLVILSNLPALEAKIGL